MDLIITTVEIAILMMLPLVIFYMRSLWNRKYFISIIALLYLIWYSTYALLHESSHVFGAWIMGKEILDYQLIPHFWEGQLGSGYVKYDFRGDSKDFLIIIMPYLRDIVFLLIGYMLFRKRTFKQPFWAGFILLIFVLSPLFDIVNNYVAYLLGSLNDFNALKASSNGIISNLIGLTFITQMRR